MMKKLCLYVIGLLIIGSLLSAITNVVLDFVPYFMAGLTLTIPVYGAVRNKTQKGVNLQSVALQLKKFAKPNRKSFTGYMILLIIVLNVYEKLGQVLVQSIEYCTCMVVVGFIIWETVRFICKKAKKAQFLSFGEAVKGAF